MAAWCSGGESTKPIFVGIYGAVLGGFAVSALFFLLSSFSSLSAPPLPLPTTALSTAAANLSGPTPSQPETMYNCPIWKPPPRGSRMPSPRAFRLTRDMVAARARGGVIVVTFGNYAFLDFILTWARHLTDLGVDNLLVGAMDTKLLRELYLRGVPVFDMGSGMAPEDAGWGSPTFHKMGREKVLLINTLLPFGYELLMCDTDMVWLKNPLPYLARYPDADLLTSSDQVIPTVTDDSLENWREVTGAFNIGIFHWRPTEPAKRMAKEWKDLVLSDDKLWDQNAFNDLVRKVFGQPVEGQGDLVYSYDGKLKLAVLPASIFCSGHTYFVQFLSFACSCVCSVLLISTSSVFIFLDYQAMYKQLHLEPYAVHTTFQYAGTEGKRHRLREAMLFFDQPSYYDSPGGFLSFKPNIPKHLLLDGAHNVESHFALVNYQLKQVRTALAIASLLKRTLVMPPLWCRLDRMWFGHPGVMEGTMTRQPFLCPMDHIFEVHVMMKDLPKEEFGPHIDFREYSFLENPSLPKELLNIFSPYKSVKIIQFSSMVDAFGGFSDAAVETKFRNRVKRYVGIWCCVELREIGHIYYDMYWDEKPGWKPHPPETREQDHPPWS
nr:unnamed protein product [Digitaria exilis]